MSNLFEKASRLKLTVKTTVVGDIAVDQLWDLPLKTGKLNLNTIAVALKSQLSNSENVVDLVDGDSTNITVNKERALNELRFEIVMHVINTLKAERDIKVARESLTSQLRVLDDAIEKQEQEELLSGSKEELLAKRAALLAAAKL